MANAQTTKVTGTVISAEDNEPIIGASIVVKGTTIGTVTDFNGAFSLDVPSSAKTLVVSFVGMKAQEIGVKPKVNVVLEGDNQMLDEVMIVAYGTAKKSAFTGSAATIKSEKITSRQTSNVTNALSGQVAGVQTTSNSGQPGKDAEVRIRGIGSISASNKPLYVVDGVPYDGEISAISTSDIESMTVLKDAASNALYGARGANGVVVITTKSGGKDGKATVTFDSYVGFKKIAKKLDVLSTYEFTMLDYERRVYDATTPDDWEKDIKKFTEIYGNYSDLRKKLWQS